MYCQIELYEVTATLDRLAAIELSQSVLTAEQRFAQTVGHGVADNPSVCYAVTTT